MEGFERLPTWFHGPISRVDAEDLLRKEGFSDGLFLVRQSTKDNGYVLSLCVGKGVSHFQIKNEKTKEGKPCLIFDTGNTKSSSPKFSSLGSVVHYLLNNPQALPAPLVQWCPRRDEEIESETDPKVSTDPKNPPPLPPPRNPFQETLLDCLAMGGFKASDLTENPECMGTLPRLLVKRTGSGRTPGKDPKSNNVLDVNVGDILQLLSSERDVSGNEFVICQDQDGRVLKIPLISDMEVALAPAPPLAKRRSNLLLQRKDSLQSVLDSSGTTSLLKPFAHDDKIFYRDIIKEGYLSKLPPLSNTIQAWKKRWFKLVICLHRGTEEGPVVLEYYTKPKATVPKGAINLSSMVQVCRLPAESSLVTSKRFKSVNPNCVFELHMPNRIYPLLAESPEAVDDWLITLSEIIGSTKEELSSDLKVDEACEYEGNVLSQDVNNPTAIMAITRDAVTIKDHKTFKELFSWPLKEIGSFGYVQQILWIAIGRKKTHKAKGGILCFSTPSAEDACARLDAMIRKISKNPHSRRLSRRHQMSWSSVEEEEEAPPAVAPRVAHAEDEIIGGSRFTRNELQSIGTANVLQKHLPNTPLEIVVSPGELIHVLSCTRYLDKDLYLVQVDQTSHIGLVPRRVFKMQGSDVKLLELQQQRRSSTSSRDSLLDDVTLDLYEPKRGGKPRLESESSDHEYVEPTVYEPNVSTKPKLSADKGLPPRPGAQNPPSARPLPNTDDLSEEFEYEEPVVLGQYDKKVEITLDPFTGKNHRYVNSGVPGLHADPTRRTLNPATKNAQTSPPPLPPIPGSAPGSPNHRRSRSLDATSVGTNDDDDDEDESFDYINAEVIAQFEEEQRIRFFQSRKPSESKNNNNSNNGSSGTMPRLQYEQINLSHCEDHEYVNAGVVGRHGDELLQSSDDHEYINDPYYVNGGVGSGFTGGNSLKEKNISVLIHLCNGSQLSAFMRLSSTVEDLREFIDRHNNAAGSNDYSLSYSGLTLTNGSLKLSTLNPSRVIIKQSLI